MERFMLGAIFGIMWCLPLSVVIYNTYHHLNCGIVEDEDND